MEIKSVERLKIIVFIKFIVIENGFWTKVIGIKVYTSRKNEYFVFHGAEQC